MRTGKFTWVLLVALVSSTAWSADIVSIDFKSQKLDSVIEILGSEPLTYSEQGAGTDQFVLTFTNAQLTKASSRKLDTSAFEGPVTSVSPYPVEGTEGEVRVAIQLRNPSSAVSAKSEGNKVVILVSQSDVTKSSVKVSDSEPGNNGSEKEGEAEKQIDQFVKTRTTKQFKGKPISLNVRDAEVTDVLRLIGESSGFNIVIGSDVRGKLTLSLVDVPWDQVLDIVLQSLQLGAERHNNVLRVVSLANLTREKQEELAAKKAVEAASPRVTKIIPISYATPTDIMKIVTQFGNANADAVAGAASGSGASSTTTVSVDARTNSLIVRDTAENIERITKLIGLLDTQTPQIMVEAKVIEANESFSKAVSGGLAVVGGGTASAWNAGLNSSSTGLLSATSSSASGGGEVNGLNLSGAFSLANDSKIGFIKNLKSLNALLSINESEKNVKIISAPRTVVLNGVASNIVQSQPVLFQGTQAASQTGGTIPMQQVLQANLSLNVTPTVTNDEGVLLQLNVTRDTPENIGSTSGVSSRNIQTRVLVPNGSTLVIGGIYTMDVSKFSSGIPYLRKIPVLGALFGSETEATSKSELFIFVTPRILNSKRAGLAET